MCHNCLKNNNILTRSCPIYRGSFLPTGFFSLHNFSFQFVLVAKGQKVSNMTCEASADLSRVDSISQFEFAGSQPPCTLDSRLCTYTTLCFIIGVPLARKSITLASNRICKVLWVQMNPLTNSYDCTQAF